MPIYEYDCQSCGERTEVIQRVGERPVRICPRCGGKLKKAFSAPAIRFKGSGFYITDYTSAKTEEGKGERSSSSEKAESADSGDKQEKSEKREREKSEKGEKAEKAEKAERGEKKAEPKKETKAKKTSASD